MAWYILLADGVEVEGVTANSKAEIEAWVANSIVARGLDWRVGFTVKFRDASTVYEWVKLVNGK